MEILSKFPLLREIILEDLDSDHIRELINVLKVIGKQIQILILRCVQNHEFDPDIFHELCPELVELRFNEKLF